MDRIPGSKLIDYLRPTRSAEDVTMNDDYSWDGIAGRSSGEDNYQEMYEYSDEGRPDEFYPYDNEPVARPFPTDHIPGTPFSTAYRSVFIANTTPELAPNLLRLIANAPYSYTSTAGIAPTMLQLKQHAHSLVSLIKNISISSQGGVIDNANSGQLNPEALQFIEGESFDFLNDLSRPYTGPTNPAVREHHNMPLTALLNVLEEHNIPPNGQQARPTYKVRDVCPLHHVEDHPHPPTSQSLPYTTHQALISHANEILELLDHEYMAKGGLLGILPPKEDKEEREKAETTLFGQLILYINRLAQRLHDLERLYANSMDALAGEAAIPAQTLSTLGPSGRSGREVVYPQDRFVLVNSGEDVWNHLDNEFSKKERVEDVVMNQYKRLGVTGEKLWEKDGAKEMSRGITAIDVTTRYFRLRNNPLKTVFVIPAWQQHPGTKLTRDLEAVPTVVAVVKPVWPERASMYEQRHRDEMEDYKRVKSELYGLKDKVTILSQASTVLESQLELKNAETRALKKCVEELEKIAHGDETELGRSRKELSKTMGQLQANKEEADRAYHESQALLAEAKEERRKAALMRRNINKITLNEKLAYSKQRAALEEEFAKRTRALQQRDIDNGEAAIELDKKVRARWQKQIVDTQIIFEELRAKQIEVGKGKVAPQGIKAGTNTGKKIAAEVGLLNTTALREATVESGFAEEGHSVMDSEGEWNGNIVPGDTGSVQTWDFSSAVDTD
jgi:hypothetical protein